MKDKEFLEVLLRQYCCPETTYGQSNQLEKYCLEVGEMWFYVRKIIRFSNKKCYEDVLRETDSQRELGTHIRQRQFALFTKVDTKRMLQSFITPGRLEGKSGTGRPTPEFRNI